MSDVRAIIRNAFGLPAVQETVRDTVDRMRSAGLIDQSVAAELLAIDFAQAAASAVTPRNVDGIDEIAYRGGGFRMVRRGKVWTVEEETSHGEWTQRGGHFQRRQDAWSYARQLKRRSGHHSRNRDAHQAVVASHLMGVSFSPDQATRDAALALLALLPILDLELTDSAEQPGQCNVNDLGVRLSAPDHVVDALELITRDSGIVRQVVRNLLHSASPSVGEFGDSTVGDGQAAEGEPRSSAAAPPAGPQVIRINSDLLEVLGTPIGGQSALLILSHAQTQELIAELTGATL